jgi:hypothetical protein
VCTVTPVGSSSRAFDSLIDVVPKSALYGPSPSSCSWYCRTTTVYVTVTGPKRLLTVGLTVSCRLLLPPQLNVLDAEPALTETATLSML